MIPTWLGCIQGRCEETFHQHFAEFAEAPGIAGIALEQQGDAWSPEAKLDCESPGYHT